MTRINGEVLCEVGKLVCGEKGEEQAFLRQSLLQPSDNPFHSSIDSDM